jgi:hypothetical protein
VTRRNLASNKRTRWSGENGRLWSCLNIVADDLTQATEQTLTVRWTVAPSWASLSINTSAITELTHSSPWFGGIFIDRWHTINIDH